MRVFVDVNVPMYAAGVDHPYKDACIWVMSELVMDRWQGETDTESLQEILHRYGARGRTDIGLQVVAHMRAVVDHIHPIGDHTMRLTERNFARFTPGGMQARDCIHLAVMQEQGISQIITADRHFDNLPGITRLDPLALYRDAGSPDISALLER